MKGYDVVHLHIRTLILRLIYLLPSLKNHSVCHELWHPYHHSQPKRFESSHAHRPKSLKRAIIASESRCPPCRPSLWHHDASWFVSLLLWLLCVNPVLDNLCFLFRLHFLWGYAVHTNIDLYTCRLTPMQTHAHKLARTRGCTHARRHTWVHHGYIFVSISSTCFAKNVYWVYWLQTFVSNYRCILHMQYMLAVWTATTSFTSRLWQLL